MSFKARLAANIMRAGGVVSLPTDTIQGLSCLPFFDSLMRLVNLKQRSHNKGLILISSNLDYFIPYVEDAALLDKIKLGSVPTTYIVKAHKNTPKMLLGGHDTVAIRLTNNSLIDELCQLTGSALVSTSANLSGYPVAQSSLKLRLYFKGQLDYIIVPVTTNSNPSSIINLHTGEKLR